MIRARRWVPPRASRRRLLRALALLGGAAAAPSQALQLSWDGAHYLKVPVQLGADTRLVMPEPFDDVWERDGEVACTLLDSQTLIIRPRVAPIEQRLTLRGHRSGSLYLARVSSALEYAPIVVVQNPALQREDNPNGGAPSVPGLLRSMMRGVSPPGFVIEPSARVLLDQAPYRIRALEVWRSPRLVGVLAQLDATLSGATLPVVPANILIEIPELGRLRAMAADNFELDMQHPGTRVYLVYAH